LFTFTSRATRNGVPAQLQTGIVVLVVVTEVVLVVTEVHVVGVILGGPGDDLDHVGTTRGHHDAQASGEADQLDAVAIRPREKGDVVEPRSVRAVGELLTGHGIERRRSGHHPDHGRVPGDVDHPVVVAVAVHRAANVVREHW
jgi:hypothetical protein